MKARLEQIEARLDADVQRWHDHGHIPDTGDDRDGTTEEGNATAESEKKRGGKRTGENVRSRVNSANSGNSTSGNIKVVERGEELLDAPSSWANRTEAALNKEAREEDKTVITGRTIGNQGYGTSIRVRTEWGKFGNHGHILHQYKHGDNFKLPLGIGDSCSPLPERWCVTVPDSFDTEVLLGTRVYFNVYGTGYEVGIYEYVWQRDLPEGLKMREVCNDGTEHWGWAIITTESVLLGIEILICRETRDRWALIGRCVRRALEPASVPGLEGVQQVGGVVSLFLGWMDGFEPTMYPGGHGS